MTEQQTVFRNKVEKTGAFDTIETYIQGMKFGTVTIHVEDGKIIQVDKLEKVRFK